MEKELKYKRELITPELAQSLLNQNTHNRNIRMPLVWQYSADMSNGKWKRNTAETIKIASSGRILDGQHRLKAVVHSNTCQYMDIVYDMDASVFDVIDTGKSRNAGDVFKISGIKNANTVPGIISVYNRLKKSYVADTREKYVVGTNQDILKQYYENPNFWARITTETIGFYAAFAKILAPSMIGGVHAYLHEINGELSNDFMNQMCRGEDIENDTIRLLRNVLIKDKMSSRKMPPQNKLMLIVKTWNNFVTGKEIKHLKYNPDNEGKISACKPNRGW